MSFEEIDERVPFAQQLGENDGPIVVFNTIKVAPEDVDAFIEAWADSTEILTTRPGFVSTQLYRGISGSSTFVAQSVWESVATYRDAAIRPDMQERISRFPQSMVATPHIFSAEGMPGSAASISES